MSKAELVASIQKTLGKEISAVGNMSEYVAETDEEVIDASGSRLVPGVTRLSGLSVRGARRSACVSFAAGADFVKTSTGFNGDGATVEQVQVMLKTCAGRSV